MEGAEGGDRVAKGEKRSFIARAERVEGEEEPSPGRREERWGVLER